MTEDYSPDEKLLDTYSQRFFVVSEQPYLQDTYILWDSVKMSVKNFQERK